ncbi:MAG: hypothetical protein EOO71_09255 [Myxococcaceae bacterium]|nr:MAG: hypothetical protein EOO71_09255 [Myxococcaceae bacterium]
MKALWRSLSLSTLAVLLSCASVTGRPSDAEGHLDERIRQAATLVWLDDLAGARKQLSGVLEEAPGNPSALVLQACLLLEQGDLEAAGQTVKRLDAVAPLQPETHILQELLKQRRRTPQPGWSEALRRAWWDAGTRNLSEEGLPPLLTADTEALSPTVWARTQSADDRFMAVLADSASDAQVRWIADHVSELQDPDLLISALEYFQPREGPLPEVRARAREVLRARLAPVAAVEARESQLPLLLLLEGAPRDALLTREELLALERIAALPSYRSLPVSQVYADAERRLKAVGVPHPGNAPFMVAVTSLHTDAPFWLFKRVEASKDRLSSEERMRLGRSVWMLGGRVAAGTTLLEHQLGFRLIEQGAGLMGDEGQQALAASELRKGYAVSAASSQLSVDRWPLPSLHREWLKASLANEWEHLNLLLVEP